MAETTFFLDGKVIGSAADAASFAPRLRELVRTGVVPASRVRDITAETRTAMALTDAESERIAVRELARQRPTHLETVGGNVLPIAADAKPYRSEFGRISHGQTEYREWYRAEDGSKIMVTRATYLNDGIVAWEVEEDGK